MKENSSDQGNDAYANGSRVNYPSYNTSPLPPNASGMSSTASQLAAQIKLGWNLGNTLEAIGGETAWGNPLTTKALIDRVKASFSWVIGLPTGNPNTNGCKMATRKKTHPHNNCKICVCSVNT